MSIFVVVAALLGPAAALWLEKRAASWLNPVIVCYLIGVLLALVGTSEAGREAAKIVAEASIPLAIPLLLFASDPASLRRLSRPSLIGFGLAMVSVTIAASAGSAFFSDLKASGDIAGMLVGVYTGGTPNMVAIGQALDVPEETFLLLNASDVVLGAAYLLFLMTAARPLLSRIFPAFDEASVLPSDDQGDADEGATSVRNIVVGGSIGLGLSITIAAAAAGLTHLVMGELHVAGVILGITTGGIVAALFAPVRRLDGTSELGNYLILVFCVAIGAQTDLEALFAASSVIFLYCATVMGGAILIHLTLCRVARLDADTTIVTSTAAVYGPPFVPLVARAIGNDRLILPGLAVGILGYVVGNYLGIGLAWVLAG